MLFFYYGENSFDSYQQTKKIVGQFQKIVDKDKYNTEYLDGENITLDDFFHAVKASGFLAKKKIIIIKNIFDNKKLKDIQDEIIKFLKTQKDIKEENYILFWQNKKPDSRTKLYKTLSKFKNSKEFINPTGSKLIKWIEIKVSKYNKTIDAKAINLLISYVGNNLWQLNQEINKLANYSKENIKAEDVKKVVKAKADDNIFNLVDALGNKNKSLALRLIEGQLNDGVNIQYILNMAIRQFRLIIKAKALAGQTKYAEALAQVMQVHPMVARKILPQRELYTMDQLKNIYNKLLYFDKQSKTSSLDNRILFVKMIIEL